MTGKLISICPELCFPLAGFMMQNIPESSEAGYFHKSTLRKGGFLYLLKPVEVGISGETMLCTIVIYF